jgi:hypothetical protein
MGTLHEELRMCFKEMKQKKLFKNMRQSNKTNYRSEEYRKWLASKKLEDITACKSTFNTLYCWQQHMQCTNTGKK